MRQSTLVFRDRRPREGVMSNIVDVCCSLFFSLILIAIFNALSIACIAIGASYLDEQYCAEKNIAPVLIATGCIAIFLSVFEGRAKLVVAREGDRIEEKRDCWYFFLQLVRIAQFGLFIYLCVLVFNLSPHVQYVPSDPNYCHPTLFLFAFWSIIFGIICCGIFFFFLCCCCCCIALAA